MNPNYSLFPFPDKPELELTPSLVKFASDAGNTGKLICRSKSSPLARYTWSRNGTPINSNTTGKYFTTYRQLDALTSESTLIITHVTNSDYGNYECVARNDLGFSTTSPRLEVTSAPDPPDALTVANVTHNSVTLTWTPGFDGGMRSSYRIRYRYIFETGKINFSINYAFIFKMKTKNSKNIIMFFQINNTLHYYYIMLHYQCVLKCQYCRNMSCKDTI